jgi:hypothetical protein
MEEKELLQIIASIKEKTCIGCEGDTDLDVLRTLDELFDTICLGMNISEEAEKIYKKLLPDMTKGASDIEKKAFMYGAQTIINLVDELQRNEALLFYKPSDEPEETTLGEIVGFLDELRGRKDTF